jgi:hypothetical protein
MMLTARTLARLLHFPGRPRDARDGASLSTRQMYGCNSADPPVQVPLATCLWSQMQIMLTSLSVLPSTERHVAFDNAFMRTCLGAAGDHKIQKNMQTTNCQIGRFPRHGTLALVLPFQPRLLEESLEASGANLSSQLPRERFSSIRRPTSRESIPLAPATSVAAATGTGRSRCLPLVYHPLVLPLSTVCLLSCGTGPQL